MDDAPMARLRELQKRPRDDKEDGTHTKQSRPIMTMDEMRHLRFIQKSTEKERSAVQSSSR